MPITMLDPRRSAADAVDVVVAFSQGGTMLAIYMDEMRKARQGLFKGDVAKKWWVYRCRKGKSSTETRSFDDLDVDKFSAFEIDELNWI